MNQRDSETRSASVFKTVITDIHLWIPLATLLIGLLLLHKLM